MKTIILFGFLALMFCSGILRAGNEEWILYKTIDGVQIYSKVVPCTMSTDPNFTNPNQEILIFKFINTNSKEVSVSWDFDVWYGQSCRTCNLKADQKKDYTHKLKIKANGKIEGTCTDVLSSGLMLLSGIPNKANQKKLSKFEMNNLTVILQNK